MHHSYLSFFQRTRRPQLWVGVCLLLFVTLLACYAGTSHAQSLTPRLWMPLVSKSTPPSLTGPVTWRWTRWDDLTADSYVFVDWDGDGKNEIVPARPAASGGSDPNFRANPIFAIRQTSDNFFDVVWAAPRSNGWGLGDVDGDKRQELWTITADGQVDVYQPGAFAPDTLGRIALSTGQGVLYATGADLLGSGQQVMIVALAGGGGTGSIAAYRLPSLTLLWRRSSSSVQPAMLTAQFDDDPQLEVLVKDGGLILDGATGDVEWAIGGLSNVAAGDIDGDHRDELVICNSTGLIGVDVDTQSEQWRLPWTSGSGERVALGDLTGDGRPEIILTGLGGSNIITVMDVDTREPLWTVDTGNYTGVTGMAAGDADNDGHPDLVWADESFHVVSGGASGPRFDAPATGYVTRVIPMQMDADPAWEMVIFSGEYLYYGQPATYRIIDSETGATERQLALGIDSVPYADGLSPAVTVNLDADPWPELVIGSGLDLYALDHNGKRLVKAGLGDTAMPLWAGDIDGDGQIEVLTTSGNRISAHRLDTLAFKWRSDVYNGVREVVVADVDGDGRKEILFTDYDGALLALDGVTHALRWQMPATQRDSALAVGDVNSDGQMEIVTVENGWLHFYSGITRQLLSVGPQLPQGRLPVNSARQLALLPLLGTSYPQLALATENGAYLYRVATDAQPFAAINDPADQVAMVERDSDGRKDLLVAGWAGVNVYHLSFSPCEHSPLVVMAVQPVAGQDLVSRDVPVTAVLSHAPELGTVRPGNVRLLAGGTVLPAAVSYAPTSHTLYLRPTGLLPANTNVTAWLGPGLHDECGNPVFANGAAANTYQWSFRTGSGVDTFGPAAGSLALSPAAPWVGTRLMLTGRLDDTNAGGASGIARGEYMLDAPGTPGEGTPTTAADGAFGGRSEQVMAGIDTENWVTLTCTIYVRGQDTRGNWGPAAAINVTLQQIAEGGWPTFGQNVARTGYQAAVTTTTGYDLAWTAAMGANGATGQSAAANGIIVTAVGPSSVYAVIERRVVATKATTGQELWHRAFYNLVVSPPTIAYGYVYFQVTDGYVTGSQTYLYALALADGRLVWRTHFDAQAQDYYAPAVVGGRVFAPCGPYSGLCAWDAFDGRQIWYQQESQYNRWTPTVADGVVYNLLPSGDGPCYLDGHGSSDGRLLWHLSVGSWNWLGYGVDRLPSVSDGTAFITLQSQGHNDLIAVDVATHGVKWRVSGQFIGTPAVADGQVFALDGTALRVYEAATGAFQWSHDTSEALFNQPIITPGHVFVSSTKQTWMINRTTRNVDWATNHGGWLTLTGDQLIVTEEGGSVVAYRPR
jgi:hypothetical protein